MNSKIDLQDLVGYCKQLPTFRDALPIMMFIKDWGIENRALEDAMLAEREVRNHFRLMTPQSENEEHKKLPLITETPEMPEFKFFSYVSDEKAVEFKEVLRECIAKIDTEGKKEWFCIYAAWRYYRGERDAKAAYVNFFTDIDALFPGLLKDLKTDEETNRKYKPYCDMLRYEYNNWAVDNGKLPPMQVWTHRDWTSKYQKNTKATIKRMQELVRTFFVSFAQLLNH